MIEGGNSAAPGPRRRENEPASFSTAHRRELAGLGIGPAQVAALEKSLRYLQVFAQPRPPAADVRDALAGIRDRAEADITELEALLAGYVPAKVEAAAMWAFYLARDPALGRADFEVPWHTEATLVIQQEIASARRRSLAAQQAMEEVKGRRQQMVSPTPVGLIHSVLQQGRDRGTPEIVFSYAAGSAFSRIVSICMGAAGGDESRSYERWIKAYAASTVRGDDDEPDPDAALEDL